MNGLDQIALRLLAATVLSAVVGIERQWRGHFAGLRTHMLVGIGAALATAAGIYGFGAGGGHLNSSPDRIAAQIVSGIGFLGAGTILKQESGVQGLTTAATLWAMGAIGIACGAGLWGAAALTTAVLMLTLVPIGVAERYLQPGSRALLITIGLQAGSTELPALEAVVTGAGGTVHSIARRHSDGGARSEVVMDVENCDGASLAALVTAFEAVPGVRDVSVQRARHGMLG